MIKTFTTPHDFTVMLYITIMFQNNVTFLVRINRISIECRLILLRRN